MPFKTYPNEHIGRLEFIILIALMMAIGALSIDTMLPAFPRMTHDFGLQAEQANHIQWVVYAYMIGFSFAQLIYGALGDYFGRRPIVLLGLSIFALASIGAALSPNFYFLLAMRVLQGVGLAAMRVLTAAMVRDRFSGHAMSQVMSMIMMVFIIVPIIAPSLGQLLLFRFQWHSIFWGLLLYALILGTWFTSRMPETLDPNFRRPISLASMWDSLKQCVHNRSTFGYATAVGLMQGVLMAYIGSSEQIFQRDVYQLGEHFPLMFGAIAMSMGLAAFTNSRLVARFGMRRMAHSALWLFLTLTSVLTVSAWAFNGHPPIALFAPLLAACLFCFSIMMPNFNTISLEPMRAIAGSASSWTGFYTSLIGAILGSLIGQAFNGTVLPLTLGYWLIGLLVLATVFWTERRLPLHLGSEVAHH